MVAPIPRPGKWLAEYEEHLVQLHRLIAQGRGDSAEADTVRDEMDLPWRKMAPVELDLVRGLSADLYKVSEMPADSPRKDDAVVRPISAAMADEDWQRVLELIRKDENQIPAAIASFWRGQCYAALGLAKAAIQFFGHSAKLHPESPLFWSYWMDSLMSENNETEALRVAEQAVSISSAPEILLRAAAIMFLNAELMSGNAADHLENKALEISARGLQMVAGTAKERELQRQIIANHLHNAMSLARRGKLAEARAECNKALTLNPQSMDAFLVLGLLDKESHERGQPVRLDVTRALVPTLSNRETNSSLPADHIAIFSN